MDSHLQVVDYVLIVASVVVSAVAGFYYGAIRKKNDSLEEYFLASRSLSTLKIACSYFSTILTSGFLVGYVAEVYFYGTQVMVKFVVIGFGRYAALALFLPIYYKIGSHDINKIYEIKLNKEFRYVLTTVTVVFLILAVSISIYSTSITMSGATGINKWIFIFVLTTLCSFYTALGGVRGVTLADMIQGFVIVSSTVLIMIVGLIAVGGFGNIWERNLSGSRLEFFNFDTDMKVRHTFWTATIAAVVRVFALSCIDATTMLRLMTSSSIKKSLKAAKFGTILVMVTLLLGSFMGLIVYAAYYNCDPIASGRINNSNQLIATFINSLSNYWGLAGVFYSSLICAAISTISSQLNALSALIMETYIKPFISTTNDAYYTRLAKITTFILSIFALLCTIIIQRFQNVYVATIVLSSISIGPQFAVLLIITLFPQTKIKSTIGGYAGGVLFMLWLVIGSLLFPTTGDTKPISTVGCPYSLNTTNTTILINGFNGNSTNTTTPTLTANNSFQWNSIFPLAPISYNWFCIMTILVVIILTSIFSAIAGRETKRAVDINLIPDCVQKLHKKLSPKWKRVFRCDVYANENEEMMTTLQKKNLLHEVQNQQHANADDQ